MRADWDIFCNVIDNFGDIGVAWRLARDLARAHGLAVRLWVDDLDAFSRIWPAVSPSRERQICESVEIRAWCKPFGDTVPAQVVVEAFGCALPETYLVAMTAQSPAPVWINLEYLSAEAWVGAHHGLPSPHPRLPLVKHFFFPGFAADTGGLLVEPDVAPRRKAFREAETAAYWHALGLPPQRPEELRVSLFGYENPALPELLDAWAQGARPVTCLVPEGRVIPQVSAWLGVTALAAGASHRRAELDIHVLPFTDQDRYDRLLWACDLNFVRGEDSCVRAQWAARPMVWQAYPQAEAAHWAKLEALLGRYVAGLDEVAAQAVAGMWRCWNGVDGAPPMDAAWAAWRRHEVGIERHAEAWCERLAQAGRLTDKLVDFAESRLK